MLYNYGIRVKQYNKEYSMSITIEQKTCLRCGGKWFPRSLEEPNVCPKCGSPYWDKPYKYNRTDKKLNIEGEQKHDY
jgi:predicted Zn-ribbon and HTH transcriptional regulator